jgi:cysteinyl-tRNA synthetase
MSRSGSRGCTSRRRRTDVRLFDTARGAVVPFEPGPIVTMYTCGITPYDSAHLGHVATYLTYDVLQRRLRDLGHETRCVRNVTDVDDDILRKARSLGVYYLDLAAEETARFDRDMAAMGMLASYSEPRATSAISDILRLIGHLVDDSAAYTAGGAVYFDTAKSSQFGHLFGLDRATMLQRAAEHGGHPDDSVTRSISSSGNRRWRESRLGSPDGAQGDPDGMSSAPLSSSASSERRSTCTAGDPISSSRTTSVRRWPRSQ